MLLDTSVYLASESQWIVRTEYTVANIKALRVQCSHNHCDTAQEGGAGERRRIKMEPNVVLSSTWQEPLRRNREHGSEIEKHAMKKVTC